MTHNSQLEQRYINNRTWFAFCGAALAFGIFWMIFASGIVSIAYTTVAFMLFLQAGVNTEMSARALRDHDAH